jgi:hypothetical protein
MRCDADVALMFKALILNISGDQDLEAKGSNELDD